MQEQELTISLKGTAGIRHEHPRKFQTELHILQPKINCKRNTDLSVKMKTKVK